jgi:small subunit ribosomal protein S9
MALEGTKYYATGRRKSSVARVWLKPGDGKILINRKSIEDYFSRPTHKVLVITPLRLLGAEAKYDVWANVTGGGASGQAGAIRLGISRALLNMDGNLRAQLRKAGLLTRDPRVKERKKYGQRGARARFQFSKR